jgi:integrase
VWAAHWQLVDLEPDCVHEVPGQGAWLKIPLGTLDTERMVPLDDETVNLVDRIVPTARWVGPSPAPGRPAEFMLTHHGRRLAPETLRAELSRAATDARLDHGTPHQLRHTHTTALNRACAWRPSPPCWAAHAHDHPLRPHRQPDVGRFSPVVHVGGTASIAAAFETVATAVPTGYATVQDASGEPSYSRPPVSPSDTG